jgi:hypothetical protein
MPGGRRKCRGGCGRWLTDEESVARGYGRVCAERLGIATSPPPKPARTPPATTPVPIAPGQTELPLIPFQPTLESL